MKIQKLNSLFLGLLVCLAPLCNAAEDKRADEKPLFIAHYMTWFGLPEMSGDWFQWRFSLAGVALEKHHYPDLILPNGRRDIAAVHYPVIGPYDSTNPDALEYHILLAQESGIDGFMVNWYGFENDDGKRRQEDKGFGTLLKRAEKLQFKVCLNLDDKSLFPPFRKANSRRECVELLKKTLRRIYKDYGTSPGYLKIDGKPVLSNFGWAYSKGIELKETSFSAQEWKEALDAMGANRFYFIHDHQWDWRRSIEGAGFVQFSDSVFGWVGMRDDRIKFLEEAKKLVREGKMKMVTGHANPGFDNTPCWGWGAGIQKILRRNGDEYREQLDESLAAGAKFIQLITWNDFTEGSTIEPTEEYGNLYLDITSDYANRWSREKIYGRMLDLPKKIYAERGRARDIKESGFFSQEKISALENRIDEAIAFYSRHDRPKTETLLKDIEEQLDAEERRMPHSPKPECSLASSATDYFAGETAELFLKIKNPLSENLPVTVEIQAYGIPQKWLASCEKSAWIKPREEITLSFPVQIPADAKDGLGWLTATVDTPYLPVTSNVSYLRIHENLLRAEVGPVNLLRAETKENLSLILEVRQKEEEKVKISFSAPKGWKAEPETISRKLPREGTILFPFTLSALSPHSSDAVLKIRIQCGGMEKIVEEPFALIPSGEAAVLEGDINQDGIGDFVLGNESVEFQCTPAIGGRLLSFVNRKTGRNQIFLDYPRVPRTGGEAWEKWAEYGGINDVFPEGWPGMIWNNDWEARLHKKTGGEVSVTMVAKTGNGLGIQREISLRPQSSLVSVKYEIENLSGQVKEVDWSNHPDLSPGGSAGAEDLFIVPATVDGRRSIVEKTFQPRYQKSSFVPEENWMLAYDSKSREYFGQIFDRSIAENVGIWEGKNFYTMEIVLKKMQLRPGEKKNFTIHYLIGQDEKGLAIKKIRDSE